MFHRAVTVERSVCEKWEKSGSLDDEFPSAVVANCDSFVNFKKGSHSLTILKRRPRGNYMGMTDVEYQIAYTVLTPTEIKDALNLKAGINPYHSKAYGSSADGIESLFWNNLDCLRKTLDYIDSINPLSEIKNEVYASVGIKLDLAENVQTSTRKI